MLPFRPEVSCPLDGISLLDLSRLVAGNMLSLQLADFGAEVVKVEDPDRGDPLRAWRVEGHSLFWKVYARNKKSITLDLRKSRAKELLLDLVQRSHVLIENFRPGTLERMGLAPTILQARNPRLVIVRVSGWGQTGPYAERPGFGTLVEGMSGYAAKTGFPDRAPVLPPTALADMVAGLYGAYAVMVALREVETKGGKGQVIDLALLEPIHSDWLRRGRLQGGRHRPEASGQPIEHYQSSQRLSDPRRPMDLHFGLHPVDGRAPLCCRWCSEHDQGSPLCRQQCATSSCRRGGTTSF